MEYANKPDFKLIPVKTFLEKLRLILIKTSGDKISLLRTERLNSIVTNTVGNHFFFSCQLFRDTKKKQSGNESSKSKATLRVLSWVPLMKSLYLCPQDTLPILNIAR